MAAILVNAIVPYLNSEEGYAWVSDATLAKDMGCRNVSAVERTMQQAADEIGVITRDTVAVIRPDGKVTGRNRRIYPSRPEGMADALANHRTPKALPNPENGSEKQIATIGRPILGVRESGVAMTEPRTLNHRTLNRTPRESGKIQDTDSRSEKDTDSNVLGMDSGFGDKARAFVHDLSRIGPNDRSTDEEVAALLGVGRRVYVDVKAGRLDHDATRTVVDHLSDAARRAWIDHRAEVGVMFSHFKQLLPEAA